MDGGANKITLKEAKENFTNFGISNPNHPQMKNIIRKPDQHDERDPNWQQLEYPKN